MASTEFDRIIAELELADFSPLPDATRERKRFHEANAAIPIADDVTIVPVLDEPVRGEWVRKGGSGVAPDADDPVLLYLHGGGYMVGSSQTCRPVTSWLASHTGITVLAIDYALLPEQGHAEALEDVIDAFRWLRARGHSAPRIALAGDSAGAALALATMLHLRDIEPLPGCAYLLSPGVDMTHSGWLAPQFSLRDPWVPESLMQHVQRGFEAAGVDALHPLVSPLYADLRGLPPILVHVGQRERLRDSIVRLVGKARRDGLVVVLEEWEEMFHNWATLPGRLPEADQALEAASAFLVEHLSGGAPPLKELNTVQPEYTKEIS